MPKNKKNRKSVKKRAPKKISQQKQELKLEFLDSDIHDSYMESRKNLVNNWLDTGVDLCTKNTLMHALLLGEVEVLEKLFANGSIAETLAEFDPIQVYIILYRTLIGGAYNSSRLVIEKAPQLFADDTFPPFRDFIKLIADKLTTTKNDDSAAVVDYNKLYDLSPKIAKEVFFQLCYDANREVVKIIKKHPGLTEETKFGLTGLEIVVLFGSRKNDSERVLKYLAKLAAIMIRSDSKFLVKGKLPNQDACRIIQKKILEDAQNKNLQDIERFLKILPINILEIPPYIAAENTLRILEMQQSFNFLFGKKLQLNSDKLKTIKQLITENDYLDLETLQRLTALFSTTGLAFTIENFCEVYGVKLDSVQRTAVLSELSACNVCIKRYDLVEKQGKEVKNTLLAKEGLSAAEKKVLINGLDNLLHCYGKNSAEGAKISNLLMQFNDKGTNMDSVFHCFIVALSNRDANKALETVKKMGNYDLELLCLRIMEYNKMDHNGEALIESLNKVMQNESIDIMTKDVIQRYFKYFRVVKKSNYKEKFADLYANKSLVGCFLIANKYGDRELYQKLDELLASGEYDSWPIMAEFNLAVIKALVVTAIGDFAKACDLLISLSPQQIKNGYDDYKDFLAKAARMLAKINFFNAELVDQLLQVALIAGATPKKIKSTEKEIKEALVKHKEMLAKEQNKKGDTEYEFFASQEIIAMSDDEIVQLLGEIEKPDYSGKYLYEADLHLMYQTRKIQNSLLKNLQKLADSEEGSDTIRWLVKGQEIDSKASDVFYIDNYKGHELWGKVDLELDVRYEIAINNAIKNGCIAPKSKGKNGVKIIGDTAKIKTPLSKRLYSKKMHVSDTGEALIIFDAIDSHDRVIKLTNENGILVGEELLNPVSISEADNKSFEAGFAFPADEFETKDDLMEMHLSGDELTP